MYRNSTGDQAHNSEGKTLRDRDEDLPNPGNTNDPLVTLGGNGKGDGGDDDSDNS